MSSLPLPESQLSTKTGNEPDAPLVTDQSTRLPLRKVLTIFGVLQLVLFLSFMDQTSVSTVLPKISEDLGSADRIGWVGTAFLIATCSSQMILARFSDIFGRKFMLMAVICIFIAGNILCGFAQNAIWLFAARGLSGMGAGGLNSLAMIIVSDVVSLKERGRFQGLIAIAVGLGNGLGPLVGGGLSTISWRWAFWISPPFLFVSLFPIWFFLPQKPMAGGALAKIRQIDFLGSALSMAGAILLLVPLSGGGTIYAWNSALVISMLAVSIVLIGFFLAVQYGFAKMPILPLRIFRYRTVALVFASALCQGWVHYGQIFYLPMYFQEILGYSTTMSGVLLLPMVVIQPFTSTLCGQITTRTGYVVPQLRAGCSIWLVGVGMMYRLGKESGLGYLIPTLLIAGVGVGMTMQSTLVTAQAGAPASDRAVVTGARNTARSLGGAIGLSVCGNIRNMAVKSYLISIPGITSATASQIVTSGVSAVNDTDSTLRGEATRAVMSGLHNVFLSFIPVTALAMLFTYFIKAGSLLAGEISANAVFARTSVFTKRNLMRFKKKFKLLAGSLPTKRKKTVGSIQTKALSTRSSLLLLITYLQGYCAHYISSPASKRT
ncbi:MFS general substrate transporter [Cylindrobasidium torrendii FP15055 ss-10]|uniref:MFS general substrate transporter n=1 Tax=Cylindrobasidium torrendii FP15055 ss-10 TaxID=1314674 RepID=A0A0D7BC76_9AGAR|nr:MFS general substrate transporter [Cylindrobasidium torrendii FP15055 ss-10]